MIDNLLRVTLHGFSVTAQTHLALLTGDDDVLVAAAALFRRAVDPAAGADHVAHQVPVRSVSRRHDGQVQRELEQLFHSLEIKDIDIMVRY